MKSKALGMFTLLFILSHFTQGQSGKILTIEECYSLAKENYPLIKQMAIIEKTKEYSVENASKGYLPQLFINGQATYQSAVTEVPTAVPAFSMPPISKDQYKIYGEINQSLTDPFLISQQKNLAKATEEKEMQKYEVELYKLKERINQIYFGILLIDGQIAQTELLKKDIQTGINKTDAAIANGIALKSNANQLKAELLKAEQRIIELVSMKKGYTGMLSLFIKQPVNESTSFQKPVSQTVSVSINRPELKLYDIQKKSFDIQNKLNNSRNIPKLGLFFQGGYGRPALNFLNDNFEWFYVGGIRLNWNIGGFYTRSNEKQQVILNQNTLDIQKEIFIFNTNLALSQQGEEIAKYQNLTTTDTEIINLRQSITTTAKSQLENGTITTNDYITFLNAEDQARQNLVLHEIQLLMAQYNFQTTSGN